MGSGAAARPAWWRPSLIGLYLGSVWAALTFAPSLIPRPWIFQGLLAGIAFALGYGLGVALTRIWRYLELPQPDPRWNRPIFAIVVAITVLRVGWSMWNALAWQNETRALMKMEEAGSDHALLVLLLALVVALVIIGLARAVAKGVALAADLSRRLVNRRIAAVCGGIVFLVVLVSIVNGSLVSTAITAIDRLQAATDTEDPPGAGVPVEATRSGSAGSLVAWDRLGQAGKRFVQEGPRRADIEAFTRRPAMEPIRLYVGLRSAEDVPGQAALALAELQRVDAFSRKILVIATPTGTGWIDNAGIAPLEYMQDGDTAVVAVQYSYLQSPLSLILEPGRSQSSAAIVFDSIYAHWRSLPQATRPRLYLFGLSLGSHGSETSVPISAYVSEPFQGAVWAGPPFRNSIWRTIQRRRNEGSPAWLPHFEDGSLFRVRGPSGELGSKGDAWGPIRVVYVVNPSDAIVFFEEDMWFRQPDWMKQPRGGDISPRLQWVPVITFFQLAFDMMSAADVSPGHGHNYAAADYARAWVEVSAPGIWSEADTQRVGALLQAPQVPPEL